MFALFIPSMNLNVSAIMPIVVFSRIKSCFEKIWQDFIIQKGFIYYKGTPEM